MPNPYFRFKQFTVFHDRCAMKVTTDSCLFGAWVAEELKKAGGRFHHALDIGSGTGLLSLMVAQKNSLPIDAVEIDTDAAQQARENTDASPWRERISVIHADVLNWQSGKKYDCIFSNPPFYETDLRSETSRKNVAHHDAGLTLTQLLRLIEKCLTDNGVFYLLLPVKRENDFDVLLKNHGFHLYQKLLVKQTVTHPPFRMLVEAGKKPGQQIIETEISIKNENDAYTPAFIALLKDYYLYL